MPLADRTTAWCRHVGRETHRDSLRPIFGLIGPAPRSAARTQSAAATRPRPSEHFRTCKRTCCEARRARFQMIPICSDFSVRFSANRLSGLYCAAIETHSTVPAGHGTCRPGGGDDAPDSRNRRNLYATPPAEFDFCRRGTGVHFERGGVRKSARLPSRQK